MKRLGRLTWLLVVVAVITSPLVGCNPARHVPQGHYLLDQATITVDPKGEVPVKSLRNYLRQHPNHRVFGLARLQLGFYNMSGRDSSRWYNRWARNLGEEPVIFDRGLTLQSRRQLVQAMVNRGYSNVRVDIDTLLDPVKRRAKVNYRITAGDPQVMGRVSYNVADTSLQRIIRADSAAYTIKPGALFDRSVLDGERSRLAMLLRNNGYFDFAPDNITFFADTAANSRLVDVELVVRNPAPQAGGRHRRYEINNIYINTAADALAATPLDTIYTHGFYFVNSPDRYLKPSILDEKCHFDTGDLFNARDIERTYESLSQLGILKYINITYSPSGEKENGDQLLDVHIQLSRTRTQGVILDLEGTNSEGDLGVGASATYQHRNLGGHSELLTVKLHGSYESLSGNLDGFINDRYTELGADVSITFPKFQAPILKRSYRQRLRATTEFNATFNHQERPEYTRIIAGAGMKYKWNNPAGTLRRTFDLVDINFVSLPKTTIDFINTIAPGNPLLRYSYEDHFIMRTGYTYYKTNRQPPSGLTPGNTVAWIPGVYALRLQGETAGNLLYLFSRATGMHRSNDAYKVFGIQYAQYVKGSASYTYNLYFNPRNSVSFHAEAGVAIPYGNSSMVPFEKRFYAGGANSVRGWGVRSLGPGSYNSRNSVTDFINQCGDISLFTSMEYRSKLFWVLQGALFLDAGNIWTIRNYVTQPGGVFRFDSFYKEIALGYGLGVRFDFDFFLLRLDLGLKAHNPAANQERWPIIHPNLRRDATLHFSVGYPF